METSQETPKPSPLTFEQVMAILESQKAETLAKIEAQKTEALTNLSETLAKIEAETKARHEEFKKRDEESEKNSKEHKERMKYLESRFGSLGNTMGDIIETLVIPNLAEKFSDYGFTFTRITSNNIIQDGKKTIAEVDAILEDGDSIMIVEVKTNPRLEDIEKHIVRIEKIQAHPTRVFRGVKIYGAIACGTLRDEVKEAIFEAGFYVVCQTGYNVEILPPPEGFIAKY